MVFVNSMSDLFHEQVPFGFIRAVFEVMEDCPQHIFQVLTKRPARMLEFAKRSLNWPDHVWAGVSVENQHWANVRIPLLQQVPASIRFLSCEPLLKPVILDLRDINWVIVGGESGVRARPLEGSWVRQIRDQCAGKGIPFFFKQWGGRTSKAGGRVLDGKLWSQLPHLGKPIKIPDEVLGLTAIGFRGRSFLNGREPTYRLANGTPHSGEAPDITPLSKRLASNYELMERENRLH
jgi:protein gp37